MKVAMENIIKFKGKFQEASDKHHGRIYLFERLKECHEEKEEVITETDQENEGKEAPDLQEL
jgi:hypothetical protein